MSRRQSANHIFMIDPIAFFPNPETMETNAFQDSGKDKDNALLTRAVREEALDFRRALMDAGVTITSSRSHPKCPDMVFPNWLSTHQEGHAIIYPMLNDNRRAEKTQHLKALLTQKYGTVTDWSHYENEDIILEGTSSMVMDHINKRVYAGLSKRTNLKLCERWADMMGYRLFHFETSGPGGKPVYHTDYLMFIGTKIAGFCGECLTDGKDKEVLDSLQDTHEVIALSYKQMLSGAANALEVINDQGESCLAMSYDGWTSLDKGQKSLLKEHYAHIVTPKLPTIQKYGGGAARCMMMELF